jgi:E3 ubiquitin-protein ligase UBR7
MYEEKGKSNVKPTAYETSMEALSTLPRVNQIDAISGYNHMKDKLFEYLQTFVHNNQIVTVEDINRFFKNMKDSKQPQAQQPHFCR